MVVTNASKPERDYSLVRFQQNCDNLAGRIQKNYLALVALYVLVMIWIWFGVYLASGSNYLYLVPIQFGSFLAASVLCYILVPSVSSVNKLQPLRLPCDLIIHVLVVASLVLVLVHWYLLGGVPVISAFLSDDYVQTGMIRQNITHVIPLANYIPALLLKSVFPLLAILLIRGGKLKTSWMVVSVGLIYAISLMQKSYPLFVIVPPALYCLVVKKFARSILFLFLALLAILINWFAANPEIRPHFVVPPIFVRMEVAVSKLFGEGDQSSVQSGRRSAPGESPPMANDSTAAEQSIMMEKTTPSEGQQTKDGAGPNAEQIASKTFIGLSTRVIALPGEVVAKWFAAIPDGIPFERGCGYRFIAPLLKCSFIDNAGELYRHYYPDLYARGYRGSMNAAHFAEEYANFGSGGLMLSGILAAVVLMFAAISCGNASAVVTVALNLPFVAALGSTALHTTLLSGGWLLTMLLAFLLYR